MIVSALSDMGPYDEPITHTVISSQNIFFSGYGLRIQLHLFEYVLSVKKNTMITDWSEEIPAMMYPTNLILAVPSLSRMWHIGRIGLGPGGGYESKRFITKKPPWYPFRLAATDMKYIVDDATPDVFGFYCFPQLNVCPCSNKRYPVSARMGLKHGINNIC
tara:strand:+ start:204 stop:686 length:483 start_codon:yes stop_codon:yes gene_type:complete